MSVPVFWQFHVLDHWLVVVSSVGGDFMMFSWRLICFNILLKVAFFVPRGNYYYKHTAHQFRAGLPA